MDKRWVDEKEAEKVDGGQTIHNIYDGNEALGCRAYVRNNVFHKQKDGKEAVYIITSSLQDGKYELAKEFPTGEADDRLVVEIEFLFFLLP